MEWPNSVTGWPKCIRCQSSRVVPGGTSDEPIFRVDASIAGRRALFAVNHDVPLEILAWLCLDCGLVWHEANAEVLRDFQPGLRAKCHPEFRERLFDE